jgi:hypothetical protein
VSDLVTAQSGDAIGNLPLFQHEARKIMRSLLDDLTKLVPYVLTASGKYLTTRPGTTKNDRTILPATSAP